MSFTKRHYARLRYRRSNPNPLIGAPSPTLSEHSLNLRSLFLYYNRHIHSFVSVLILGNLDVLGVSWLIFSWMIGFVSLRDLLDDSGRLHFDFVDDVFVHGV